MLLQGREDALAELVVADSRALRPLMGRLWDPDEEVRSRAARVVGAAAAAKPDLGTEVVRRLMWALNDESATNGIHAIPALGEIGNRSPDVLAPFVPALVSMTGDPGIRLELLRALGTVAETAPELIAGQLDRLGANIDPSHREEREAFRLLVVATGKETCGGN